MHQVALMLGERDHVHFARLEKGSTRLVARVDGGKPLQAVQARAYAVKDGRAPAEAMAAYKRINEMIEDDGGTARLKFGQSTILRFTGGSDLPAVSGFALVDSGTITGRLYALSENASGEIKARVRPHTGEPYVNCTAHANLGPELRRYLFDAVRVSGTGRWTRSEGGQWNCQSLEILEVKGVKNLSLRQAIDELRKIDVEWSDDPIAEWAALEADGGA